MISTRVLLLTLFLPCLAVSGVARENFVLEGLPIRGVTVFKDGHSWVRHEGEVVLDAQGRATLENLPAPLLGTFWSAGVDPDVTLVTTIAGMVEGESEPLPAASLTDLLRANSGMVVQLTERPVTEGIPPQTWNGRLLEVPQEAMGSYVLIQHGQGTAAIALDRVLTVDFPEAPTLTWTREEEHSRLVLQYDVPDGEIPDTTQAAVSYVQMGLRWIPNYRITLQDGDMARVELQATLVNDLSDLTNVTADLVVGVPSFRMKDNLDPMSLQEQLVRVDEARGRMTDPRTYLSNSAVMSQLSFGGASVAEAPATGPELTGAERNEDLFVYRVSNVTLGSGERMVVPVAEFEVPAAISYRLSMTYGPPVEARASWSPRNHGEYARLRGKPAAMSVLKLQNTSDYPMTTAPALLFNGERIMAQSLTQYTPVGGELEIEVTQAVDIRVTKREIEKERVPNDYSWRSEKMTRIEMEGELEITNFKGKTVSLDVRRDILGKAGQADNNGTAVQRGGDWEDAFDFQNARPAWWDWYSWPWWWYANNGAGFFEWKDVALEAGDSVTLRYNWSYYWAG